MQEEIKQLSPKRNTTTATTLDELVKEQLHHFGIDAGSKYGQSLGDVAESLYQAQGNLHKLW